MTEALASNAGACRLFTPRRSGHEHPDELASRRVTDLQTINFEGKSIPFLAGDTISAALLRAGVRIFSRSPKYHRPRGPFCFAGSCAQCYVRIDGKPSLPACMTLCHESIRVERQNAIGSAGHDLLGIIDVATPHGLDHHHLMTWNRLANTTASAVARRLAGLGTLPDAAMEVAAGETRHAEVVIVGAGEAGRKAARDMAARGIDPLIIDSNDGAIAIGLYAPNPLQPNPFQTNPLPPCGGGSGRGDRTLLVRRHNHLESISFENLILATGTTSQPLAFEDNDRPGIYAARGLVDLARRHDLRLGEHAVLIGEGAEGPRQAAALREVGYAVEEVALSDNLRAIGSPVHALQIGERKVDCDLIAIAARPAPAYELAAQVDAEVALVDNESVCGFAVVVDDEGRTSIPWLSAVGSVCTKR